jgi:predicted nucleic acid-binding protein
VVAVVSDTSPIRALAHLGKLALLQTLYPQLLVPPAVVKELSLPTRTAPAVDISLFRFIQVQSPQDAIRVQQFEEYLDPGESEALVLALEVKAEVVLMDEYDGRAAAKQLGLVVIGALGVLLRAKRDGLVPAVRPLMDSLQDELAFFISPQLRAEVLTVAGELAPE